jgi:transposase
MIVIGVDVHKHSLTAVAVDETGRLLDELTVAYPDEVLGWAAQLGQERLWAVEDCRHVTRALERRLLAEGEELVRVPPKLTGAARSAGRERGKSDPIDALAVARVALREPDLDRPRPGEERYRELKLLVVHRDDLVDERRRAQQRLRWHLHQLDPSLIVPAGALDRTVWLDRVGRWLARRTPEVQVRVARDLVSRCRSLTRAISELERERATMSAQMAPALLELPGCAGVTAAKLLAEIGPIERFRSDAQLARHGGVAPLQASSGRSQRPPTRPGRQPPTQLRVAPYRDHPGTRPPRGPRLHRSQERRRQKQPRSDPLPQTTTRPHRLQHAESEHRLDIGATLAQPRVS